MIISGMTIYQYFIPNLKINPINLKKISNTKIKIRFLMIGFILDTGLSFQKMPEFRGEYGLRV